MATRIQSPFKDGVVLSVPTSKLDPMLVLPVLFNRGSYAMDLVQRPSEDEHRQYIEWLTSLIDRIDGSVSRYCYGWLSLIVLHHYACLSSSEQAVVWWSVGDWISRWFQDSNKTRIHMMLTVIAAMLSDDIIHSAYLEQRNFSLASLARLKTSFVQNADHLHQLLTQLIGKPFLHHTDIVCMADEIDRPDAEVEQENEEKQPQAEAQTTTATNRPPRRLILRIDDDNDHSYLVHWMGGQRRKWFSKGFVEKGATQWRAKIREYELAKAAKNGSEQKDDPQPSLISAVDVDQASAVTEEKEIVQPPASTAEEKAPQESVDESATSAGNIDSSMSSLIQAAHHQAPPTLTPAVIIDESVIAENELVNPSNSTQTVNIESPIAENELVDPTTSKWQQQMAELKKYLCDASAVEDELRSKIEQLESIAKVNQAAEAKKVEQLLRINATLSKQLRISERQRKQLETTVACLQQACGQQTTTTRVSMSGKRPASCVNIQPNKKRAVVD